MHVSSQENGIKHAELYCLVLVKISKKIRLGLV